MIASKTYNTQDLVLQVRKSFDPSRLKLNEWERFLNILCGDRFYQKEAIKSALIYLASGNYLCIEDLVQENSRNNPQLITRYHSIEDYKKKVQLPGKLSATIDLATGTGKSFVIYGIAQIALGVGIIDKVLVLCPSITIREELTKKFTLLASDKRLIDALPEDAHWRNPTIINANETIKPGSLCITNIHSIYASNSSSIVASLGFGQGDTCLVLNDESHHVYNKAEGRDEETQSIKKWKEFLLNTAYSFRYILGFSGTTYIDNEYFNDVIYRYSLRQAIEDRFVKKIDYVHKDDSSNENEKFQKVYQNHVANKDTYSKIKPLTILVTRDIKEAKQLQTRLSDFLFTKGEGSEEYIRTKKILVVTSHADHKHNVLKLPYVDTDETTEWIISVAMLTEGWDVKNVFQIVPMEEKAFNSKLLISQVLGRGLRLPNEYPNSRVVVFNHDSWSTKIQDLVNEILEIEERLRNSIITTGDRAKFNFILYNINYDKQPLIIENPKASNESKVFNYKGHIDLVSETFEHETETTYISIDGTQIPVNYKVEKEKFDVQEIINKIIYDFETRDWEGKVLKLQDHEYTKNNLPPREEIADYVRRSMERVGIKGDSVGKSNRTAIYSTFNTLLRQSNVSRIYSKVPESIIEVQTIKRDHESISALSLRQNSTIYHSDKYLDEIIIEDTLLTFKEVLEDDTLPRKAISSPKNSFTFKTPLDLVFVSHEPEKKFVDLLTKDENALKITSWIKSTAQSFYSIEYTIQQGSHSIQRSFNPDFFIKFDKDDIEYIIVVETKSDNDDDDENKAKYKYAKQHFTDLNAQLHENGIKQHYKFHFLSPMDFATFFEYLRDGRLINGEFYGTLEKLLNNE
jgi:type III restriction enzyme